MDKNSTTSQIFTATSAGSLTAVAAVGLIAHFGSKALLPKNAKWQDRFTFMWLAFDALTRLVFEGSFLYFSTFGRQVNTSFGPLAEMWKEYSRADSRWGSADETVVSLEILTVLGVAPLSFYIMRQLIKDDPARHYWIVVLSTAELYGGWMTFCPEWLTGNPHLDTSNALYLWVYLTFLNMIWVVMPLRFMYVSYGHIASSLRFAQTSARAKKH